MFFFFHIFSLHTIFCTPTTPCVFVLQTGVHLECLNCQFRTHISIIMIEAQSLLSWCLFKSIVYYRREYISQKTHIYRDIKWNSTSLNPIYIYIYIYKRKYWSKSDSMKMTEKHNPYRRIYYDVKLFGFSNCHQDLDIRIVHIAMDACWDNRSKCKVYNEKIQTCT